VKGTSQSSSSRDLSAQKPTRSAFAASKSAVVMLACAANSSVGGYVVEVVPSVIVYVLPSIVDGQVETVVVDSRNEPIPRGFRTQSGLLHGRCTRRRGTVRGRPGCLPCGALAGIPCPPHAVPRGERCPDRARGAWDPTGVQCNDGSGSTRERADPVQSVRDSEGDEMSTPH